VQGQPPLRAGCLTHHLVRQGRLSRVTSEKRAGSKKARLRYRLLDCGKLHSLMEITLETGRRHQIRTQLAAVGCPILGDMRYGAAVAMAQGRIALLSRRLAFDHPTKGVRLDLVCDAPKGWPWPIGGADQDRPLWSIQDYADSETGLPFDPRVNTIF
jgi:23S rRNA pseudouridine1911/1915/1917 synthase